MKSFRFFALVVGLWLALPLANLVAAPVLSGVYTGSMELRDGRLRTIPLVLSISVTERQVAGPVESVFDLQREITGAMILDQEGGVYTADITEFLIDQSRIDIQILRNNQISFRLKGRLDGNGQISGEVLSKSFGEIGTFGLQRSNRPEDFKVNYRLTTGRWEGIHKSVFDGKETPIKLFLEPKMSGVQTNPPDWEFEYTPGRTGSFEFGSSALIPIPFDSVVIDFLRRRMIVHHSNNEGLSVSAELEMADDGSITGVYNSAMHGRSATLTFKKVR